MHTHAGGAPAAIAVALDNGVLALLRYSVSACRLVTVQRVTLAPVSPPPRGQHAPAPVTLAAAPGGGALLAKGHRQLAAFFAAEAGAEEAAGAVPAVRGAAGYPTTLSLIHI